MKVQTDHNVYILGAGFSCESGLPLLNDFYSVMQDAFSAFGRTGVQREIKAIEEVLRFRKQISPVGYWANVNLDNIEELLCLAVAQNDEDVLRTLQTAIGATIRHCLEQRAPKMAKLEWVGSEAPHVAVGNTNGVRKTWTSRVAEVATAQLAGLLNPPNASMRNSFITFNYDPLVESALAGWNKEVAYGFNKGEVKEILALDEEQKTFPVLKLHGSITFGPESEHGDRLKPYDLGNMAFRQTLNPVVVPPTWNKSVPDGDMGNVWSNALDAISEASRIYIIGYSIPETDSHFRYLMAAGLQGNSNLRKIVVCNLHATSLRERVRRVFRSELEAQGRLTFVDGLLSNTILSMETFNRQPHPRLSSSTTVKSVL